MQTHNAARRNMIAGGAAYGYWALKSPSAKYVDANQEKVQSPVGWNHKGQGGVNPH